jgi:hypothetical protein
MVSKKPTPSRKKSETPLDKPAHKSAHKSAEKPAQSGKGAANPSKRATAAKTESGPETEEEGKGGSMRPDEMPAEVLEFIQAIDEYKRIHRRPFPSWSEVLEVLKTLGYERAA